MLIEPAWTGIGRLERSLPQQRAQAAELDALLGEVKGLKSQPQVATVSPIRSQGRDRDVADARRTQDLAHRAAVRRRHAADVRQRPVRHLGGAGWPASNGNWAHARPRSSSPARTPRRATLTRNWHCVWHGNETPTMRAALYLLAALVVLIITAAVLAPAQWAAGSCVPRPRAGSIWRRRGARCGTARRWWCWPPDRTPGAARASLPERLAWQLSPWSLLGRPGRPDVVAPVGTDAATGHPCPVLRRLGNAGCDHRAVAGLAAGRPGRSLEHGTARRHPDAKSGIDFRSSPAVLQATCRQSGSRHRAR